jgi:cytochrome c553
MRKNCLVLALALAFAVNASILHAEGSSEDGKDKAAACASCHGADGNSMMPSFPKLAQQNESYLVKQLQAFKDGTRKNPMMSGIAAGLSADDMADLAAFYSEQRISANEAPKPDEDDEPAEQAKAQEAINKLLAQGADLYRNGDLVREVSACIACHGPLGEGNKPAAFPLLKSQHADYLIKSLSDYKSGVRSNNPDNMMHMIAKKMSDEEIKAVSYRISMMK